MAESIVVAIITGVRYYAAGKTETAMEHEPDYLRLSQAERERKEREAKSI